MFSAPISLPSRRQAFFPGDMKTAGPLYGSILGIVASMLFFMERDNDTLKNLREKLKEISLKFRKEQLDKYWHEKNAASIDGLPTAFGLPDLQENERLLK